MRAALRAFPDGRVDLQRRDGRRRRRAVDRAARDVSKSAASELFLDYSGTSPQLPLPLNAVYGVTLSGVYYAVRARARRRISR